MIENRIEVEACRLMTRDIATVAWNRFLSSSQSGKRGHQTRHTRM